MKCLVVTVIRQTDRIRALFVEDWTTTFQRLIHQGKICGLTLLSLSQLISPPIYTVMPMNLKIHDSKNCRPPTILSGCTRGLARVNAKMQEGHSYNTHESNFRVKLFAQGSVNLQKLCFTYCTKTNTVLQSNIREGFTA